MYLNVLKKATISSKATCLNVSLQKGCICQAPECIYVKNTIFFIREKNDKNNSKKLNMFLSPSWKAVLHYFNFCIIEQFWNMFLQEKNRMRLLENWLHCKSYLAVCSKYSRWRKNRSRRLKISWGGNGRSNVSSAHHHSSDPFVFQLKTT
jgi:hypothetical protein